MNHEPEKMADFAKKMASDILQMTAVGKNMTAPKPLFSTTFW